MTRATGIERGGATIRSRTKRHNGRHGRLPVLTALARSSSGNAPLELVILAPVVLLLVSLVIAAGRTALAQNSVDAAARDAARQASIARTAVQAQQAARSAAIGDLAAQHVRCAPATVSVSTAGFGVPVGQQASVSATVTCQVRLADLLLPGVPGSTTLTATFSSPLDPYRGRTLGAGSPWRPQQSGGMS